MTEEIRLTNLIAPAYYGLHRDIRRGKYAEYFLRGGRGSAKSSFVSIEIILGLLRRPETNAIVYRRVAATIRESVYEQMLWAIEKLGLGAFFESRLSPPEIICRATGQRILFRGADDPGKSKSLKLAKGFFAYLWFEEAAEFPSMADLRTIKASVIRGGSGAACFYSYNPPLSASDWINEEALLPRQGRIVHHSCYTDVPAEWLGDGFIAEAEALRKSNERAYRHMYLGEAVGSGGRVFENLTLRTVADGEFDALDRSLNGLDFGFAVDPDAFIRVFYDAGPRRLFVAEEFFGVRTPAQRLAEEVKKRAGNETVHCDSADPRMIHELRSRGLQAVGVKKGAGSVREGIRWLQDLSEIIIDPARCPNAAREFSAYEYESDGFGNFRADCPDKNNHLIDAARYALEDYIRRRSAGTLDRGKLGI
ncbi:MAG: PBSX family phage terminase large subunit [Clostridia bacterium]|nr:PBSX family phage terminase large subunit [Clostridia bacterium]